jgi:hypothetical protein
MAAAQASSNTRHQGTPEPSACSTILRGRQDNPIERLPWLLGNSTQKLAQHG